MKLVQVTQELIEAGKSGTGAWNSKQFKLLGIDWPPKHGWRVRAEGRWISVADAESFVKFKGETIKAQKRQERSWNRYLTNLILDFDPDV